jgi:hypothetical protein
VSCHDPNPTEEREATLKPTFVSQLDRRQYSSRVSWLVFLSLLLVLGVVILAANAFAAPPNPTLSSIVVNCPSGSINTALASLDPSTENTIFVFGACTENVDISGFDRLILIAQNGASINDASGGTTTVLSIFDSPHVSVQGFTINGSGPNTVIGPGGPTELIDCNAANCFFRNNVMQNGGDGIDIFNGARAFFNGDTFQDLVTGAAGIFVGGDGLARANAVTIQRVAGDGVDVSGGFLQISNSTVQNNTGKGIGINTNGTVVTVQTTITGNTGDGIDVVGHSTLRVGRFGDATGSSITANHGVGVLVKDLSFASFQQGVPNVVKNNLGRKDVLCSPQFPATRGAHTNIGGGTTNCDEDDKE